MFTIILLHGALGDSTMFKPLVQRLSNSNNIISLDLPSHGDNAQSIEFSIENFAQFLIQYIEENKLTNVSVFGYSMGGYVAMYAVSLRPDLFGKIMTLATKYHWSEEIAASEIKMLNADMMEQKIPAFVQTLQDRHKHISWRTLVSKTASMLADLGQKNLLKLDVLKDLQVPVMIGIGDRDAMVSMDETIQTFRALPMGAFYVLPDTKHPFEQVNIDLILPILNSFFMD